MELNCFDLGGCGIFEVKTTLIPFSNLREQLRDATRRSVGMGWSNQDTHNYTSMLEHLPHMHPETFALMTGAAWVPMCMVRMALLYRMGTLYTAKWAHRFGHAQTAECAAGCGYHNDTIDHAISGCEHMEKLRTDRHNRAGSLIARTLQHNGIGAHIHSMDLGRKLTATNAPRQAPRAHRGSQPPTKIPTTIGNTLFAPTHPPDLANRRPDIVFVQRHADGTTTVHLIEIKYARDTKRTQQVLRAEDQYAGLVPHLAKKDGQTVRQHTIVLGVGGAIFRDPDVVLEEFRIAPRERARLARALHLHSILYLYKAVKWRRQLEIKHAQSQREKDRPKDPRDCEPDDQHDMTPEEVMTTVPKHKRKAGVAGTRRRPNHRRTKQRCAPNLKRNRCKEGSKESSDDRGGAKGDDDDGVKGLGFRVLGWV